MNILIIGCGQVGRTVSFLLTLNTHDTIFLYDRKDGIAKATALDLSTIAPNHLITSVEDLNALYNIGLVIVTAGTSLFD